MVEQAIVGHHLESDSLAHRPLGIVRQPQNHTNPKSLGRLCLLQMTILASPRFAILLVDERDLLVSLTTDHRPDQ